MGVTKTTLDTEPFMNAFFYTQERRLHVELIEFLHPWRKHILHVADQITDIIYRVGNVDKIIIRHSGAQVASCVPPGLDESRHPLHMHSVMIGELLSDLRKFVYGGETE